MVSLPPFQLMQSPTLRSGVVITALFPMMMTSFCFGPPLAGPLAREAPGFP